TVLVDDAPEAVGLGPVGRPFVHERRAAVGEDAVHHVAVPGDPTDVGGAEVGVVVLQVEHPLAGDVGVHHVAAGGVHHALGLSGRAAGVEDEQRMLGIERGALAGIAGFVHELVPPQIAAVVHRYGLAGAAHHHHALDRRGLA